MSFRIKFVTTLASNEDAVNSYSVNCFHLENVEIEDIIIGKRNKNSMTETDSKKLSSTSEC